MLHDMRKLFAALLAVLCFNPCVMAQQTTVKLRVIETSDVHGSFFPYDFINRKPQQGTLARVSSYVNQLRQTYGKNLILLDNGDILQGQPTCYYYNFIKTQAPNVAAEVVNYMGYDAQTIGNHDVETGHSVYDKWIREVKCPMLGANVIDVKTGKPYLHPYTVMEREGIRIAVIGLLTPAIPNWLSRNLWAGLKFDNMVTSARYWMDYVQKHEKPDVVIGLFHSGSEGGITTPEYEEDASLRVARDVPGFDLVLYGHDHTRHVDQIVNCEGKKVVCLDPANNAMTVGDAEITVTKDGKGIVTRVHGQLVDMTNQPIDKDFERHFSCQVKEVQAFVSKKIGRLAETIYTRDSFFGSSAFNDLILNLELQISGADIAFNAPLSFDAKINKGNVYMSDMFKLYKYENQLYVMRLTGEEIRKHLEMSYNLWVNTMQNPDDHLLLLNDETKGDQQRLGFKNLSFNFDSAAGIDYEVDVTKPYGEKVHILRMSNGQPFDEHKWYKVAINSYRGNGGGELLTKGAGIPRDSLESRIVWASERDQRFYLMEAIEKQKTLAPKPNHNWRFVPENWVNEAAKRDYEILFGKGSRPSAGK